MTDGDGLLAAILEDPTSDAHRLVYADWLEENGRGNDAAFIRLSIELFREGKTKEFKHGIVVDGWPKESRRRRAYEHLMLSDLADDIPVGLIKDSIWRRGMLAEIKCTAAQWVAFGDPFLNTHPVEVVRLGGWWWKARADRGSVALAAFARGMKQLAAWLECRESIVPLDGGFDFRVDLEQQTNGTRIS